MNYRRQSLTNLFMGGVFTNDQHDGIIARNGTHYLIQVVIVYIIGQTAGIPGTSADDGYIMREVDRDEPRKLHHLAHRAIIVRQPTIHCTVGQHIRILARHRRCLCHLQLLQVTRESGLGNSQPLLLQIVQQFILTTDFSA